MINQRYKYEQLVVSYWGSQITVSRVKLIHSFEMEETAEKHRIPDDVHFQYFRLTMTIMQSSHFWDNQLKQYIAWIDHRVEVTV